MSVMMKQYKKKQSGLGAHRYPVMFQQAVGKTEQK